MINSFELSREQGVILDAIDSAGYRIMGYTADNEINVVDGRDFTPTIELFGVYMSYVTTLCLPYDETFNTIKSFGVQLNKILGLHLPKHRMWVRLEEGEPKKNLYGYRGIKGPKSVRLRPEPGRPRNVDQTPTT